MQKCTIFWHFSNSQIYCPYFCTKVHFCKISCTCLPIFLQKNDKNMEDNDLFKRNIAFLMSEKGWNKKFISEKLGYGYNTFASYDFF